MNKKLFKKIGLLLVFLTFGSLTLIFIIRASGVLIRMDRPAYQPGEKARVTVVNRLWNSEVCFSSCYPYFYQKKNGVWREYLYRDCNFEDKIVKCVKPFQKKVFQTTVPSIVEGEYRISVPVCAGCNLGTVFREENRFYSEIFRVK